MKLYPKSFLTLIVFLGGALLTQGQAKYGLNLGAKLIPSKDLIKSATIDKFKQETVGYNIGGYLQTGGLVFYVRPQLGYTWHKNSTSSLSYTESSLELPISLGYRYVPFSSVFAGPTFYYVVGQNIKQDLKAITLNKLKEDITYGVHFGVRLHLGNFDFSVKYERGLKPREVEFLDNKNINLGTLDTKPEYLVLALGIKLAENL